MSSIKVATVSGGQTAVDTSTLEKFSAWFRGEIFKAGDPGYDQARTIWNAMIDRKPGLIARCTGVADVIAAVKFARENNLLTAVRSGGHNIAGKAVCDDGMVIDLSPMRWVRIEPQNRLAHVGPGATLGDFDHEAQAFGLATPLGINSTTGVAGLTLGGGFGWLTRKYGMAVDNLTAVDVVTADAQFIQANEWDHPDLLWATQGGGGNFGIVTRFEFKLHEIGREVYAGLVVYSLKEAKSVLEKYREYAANLGNNTTVWAVMRKAPPLPFLPGDVHGQPIVAFACFHTGDASEGEKAIAPVRDFGKVLGEHLGWQPYTAWQTAFDPLLTPGARNYWKSLNFTELTDGVIDVAIKHTEKLPSDECEIFFGLLAGEANKKNPEDTAYPHRDANYVMNVHGRWQKPADDEKCIAWARQFYKDTSPYATEGVYVNFLTEDEKERVQSAYGTNFKRLAQTKQTYDPDNFFRLNHNISPGM
ncbi:MAG: FAD-binding oxidoreductase [Candidatus Zixiibacteriota bacterium]|nr:MAG: FAD-binding oxidoreductase [candidate division Zixibacteria bacterium]